MDINSKRKEYSIEIRRKDKNERILAIRQKLTQDHQTQNISEIKASYHAFITSINDSNIFTYLSQIRLFSKVPEIANHLKSYFAKFYFLVIHLDQELAQKQLQIHPQIIFNDLITILINISCFQEIQLESCINNNIDNFQPLVKNLLIKDRQINTLWLIANLLYRKNQLSFQLFQQLLKYQIIQFMQERIKKKFQHQNDITIFFFFSGSFLANSQNIQDFGTYKKFLETLENLLQPENEQIDWYLLDGLAEHASEMHVHEYQILSLSLFKKCSEYCKNKKSKFIVKYLEITLIFIQSERLILENTILLEGSNLKKKIVQQYERIKKFNFIKNMEFCLENRSPEVKNCLFQIAFILLDTYAETIDLENQFLYFSLAENIKNIEKLQEKTVLKLMTYFEKLYCIILGAINLNKDEQYFEKLLKFMQETQLLQRLEQVFSQNNGNVEIIVKTLGVICCLVFSKNEILIEKIANSSLSNMLKNILLNHPNEEVAEKTKFIIDFLI